MKWHHLERHLDPLAQRQRTWRTWRALGACWVVGLVVASALWALEVNSIATLPMLVGVLIIVAVLAVRRANDWRPDYQDLARRIERDNPDLHAVLLTALEQEPEWMRQSIVRAPAGAALIRDVRTWHGGTANTSQQTRVMTSVGYYAPWFRRPGELAPCMPPDLFETLSERAQCWCRDLVLDK